MFCFFLLVRVFLFPHGESSENLPGTGLDSRRRIFAAPPKPCEIARRRGLKDIIPRFGKEFGYLSTFCMSHFAAVVKASAS